MSGRDWGMFLTLPRNIKWLSRATLATLVSHAHKLLGHLAFGVSSGLKRVDQGDFRVSELERKDRLMTSFCRVTNES